MFVDEAKPLQSPHVLCDICQETWQCAVRIDGLPYAWRRRNKLPPKWFCTCDGAHICPDCVKEDRDEYRRSVGL